MKTIYLNINNFRNATQPYENQPFNIRYKKWLEIIPSSRIEHINKFKGEDDKLRSLAASILLNMCVYEYVSSSKNASPDYSIQVSEYGKPSIPEYPSLSFSLSHSGDYAVIAFADKKECNQIGIDIQKRNEKKSVLDIAKHFYSEAEKRIIESAESDNKDAAIDLFYEIWSAKEGYIKCTGLGLSETLSDFSVVPKEEYCIEQCNNNNSPIKKSLSIIGDIFTDNGVKEAFLDNSGNFIIKNFSINSNCYKANKSINSDASSESQFIYSCFPKTKEYIIADSKSRELLAFAAKVPCPLDYSCTICFK